MTVKLAQVEAVAMYEGKRLGASIDHEKGGAIRLAFIADGGARTEYLVDAQQLFDEVVSCILDRDTTTRRARILDRPENNWSPGSGKPPPAGFFSGGVKPATRDTVNKIIRGDFNTKPEGGK